MTALRHANTHSMAASPDEFWTAMAARFEPFSEKPMLMSWLGSGG